MHSDDLLTRIAKQEQRIAKLEKALDGTLQVQSKVGHSGAPRVVPVRHATCVKPCRQTGDRIVRQLGFSRFFLLDTG